MKKVLIADIVRPPEKTVVQVQDEISATSHPGVWGRIFFWIACVLFILILLLLIFLLFAKQLDFHMIGMNVGNGVGNNAKNSASAEGSSESFGQIFGQQSPGSSTAYSSIQPARYLTADAGHISHLPLFSSSSAAISPVVAVQIATSAATASPPYYFSQGVPIKVAAQYDSEDQSSIDAAVASDTDFTILSPDPPITDCPDAQE